MMKLTRVSAVAAALACMVKDPAAATAATDLSVVSLVPTVQMMTLLTVTRELVTTSEVAAAAKLTEPEGWLIVRAPVVPAAVMVLGSMTLPPTVRDPANTALPAEDKLNKVEKTAPEEVAGALVIPNESPEEP